MGQTADVGDQETRKATIQHDLIQNLTVSIKLPGERHEDDLDEDVPKLGF